MSNGDALGGDEPLLDDARALARKLRVCPDNRTLGELLEDGGGEWAYLSPTYVVSAFGIDAKSVRSLDHAIMNWVKKIYRRTPGWYAVPSFLDH
jgi:hypothetical protein